MGVEFWAASMSEMFGGASGLLGDRGLTDEIVVRAVAIAEEPAPLTEGSPEGFVVLSIACRAALSIIAFVLSVV